VAGATTPSVEEPVIADVNEVDTGSAQTTPEANSLATGTVDAKRFNGLMGKFNAEQAARKAAETELAELRKQRIQEKPPLSDDATEAKLAAVYDLLMKEQLKTVRREALDEYPEAKPFADLVTANDPDELREMYRVISERVKAGVPAPTPEAEPPSAPPTPPVVPVTGGAVAASDATALSENLKRALDNKDIAGFVQARWEMQQLTDSNGLAPIPS